MSSNRVNPEEIRNVTVLTPRLKKLKHEWEQAEPQVYVDDTLLFTKSWQETEGLPVDIRWAKAFEKRLLECPLLIRDDEIVVGSLTKFIRGNGTLCAMKPREILEMCQSGKFARKTSDTESTKITPEDLAALTADAEYWIDNIPKVSTVNAALAYDMGEDVFDLLFDRGCVFEGRGVRYKMDRGLFQNYSAYGGGVAQVSAKCVDHGLNYVIDLCKKERERMMRKATTSILTVPLSFCANTGCWRPASFPATRLSGLPKGMLSLQERWRRRKRATGAKRSL
jgi:formate C-acetyltransferase